VTQVSSKFTHQLRQTLVTERHRQATQLFIPSMSYTPQISEFPAQFFTEPSLTSSPYIRHNKWSTSAYSSVQRSEQKRHSIVTDIKLLKID